MYRKNIFKALMVISILVLQMPINPQSPIVGVVSIEQQTDKDIYRLGPEGHPREFREHYGNPAHFHKYIIRIPPVYV